MSDQIGVMVCGHGSRSQSAIEEFAALADAVRQRIGARFPVEHGYLEFATPIIRDGLDRLRERGADHILAVPGMLFAAGHVKNDIPSVLNTYQRQHPGVTVQYGRDLGIDLRMVRAAGDRVREALDAAGDTVPMHETMLVVVGRGTSDPDANSNVSKVMRLLWEGLGFGWGETGYSGVTFPLVEPALDHAARLGYRRIVVFPYFLFTGVLVERIYAYTDVVAARHPEIEFVKAPYLNTHPLVVETFLERIEETLHGTGNMNCQMCKYREQVLGFEDEVGLAQESHHHHVEGIGVGGEHGHSHDHEDGGHGDNGHGHHPHRHGDGNGGADHHHDHGAHGHGAHGHGAHGHGEHDHHTHDHGAHGHDHSHGDHGHHPYPHADHPHGPRTLRSDIP